jgi:hypothetical protein
VKRARIYLPPGGLARQARHILLADLESFRAQLDHGGVHVAGVEQHQRVEREAKRADLIFHPLAIVLVQMAGLTMENSPGQSVPAFSQVGLGLDLVR